mmetsp:Transcript_36188/g.94796  ORF Transcript_36188/g.94796 Transcript_36188/m.94796 type:complete len:232 (-) Transcript_36188:186-881(-)
MQTQPPPWRAPCVGTAQAQDCRRSPGKDDPRSGHSERNPSQFARAAQPTRIAVSTWVLLGSLSAVHAVATAPDWQERGDGDAPETLSYSFCHPSHPGLLACLSAELLCGCCLAAAAICRCFVLCHFRSHLSCHGAAPTCCDYVLQIYIARVGPRVYHASAENVSDRHASQAHCAASLPGVQRLDGGESGSSAVLFCSCWRGGICISSKKLRVAPCHAPSTAGVGAKQSVTR